MADRPSASSSSQLGPRLLELLLRGCRDECYVMDAQGRVLFVNEAAVKNLGYSEAELLGQFLDRFEEVDLEAFRERMRNMGAEPDVATFRVTHVRKGGEKRIKDLHALYVNLDGERFAAGFLRDVTDEIESERQLARTQRAEALGVLAGGIAHDFNNMLAAIVGHVSLARLDVPANSKAAEDLLETEKACMRARTLTLQLLTFSRGGAPRMQSQRIQSIVREAATFSARGSKCALEFDLADSAPAVDVDAGQVAQVVQNLVINAAEAMSDGGTIGVAIRTIDVQHGQDWRVAGGTYVEVSVRDTGTGMSPSQLEHAFDPYFTTKASGSGLGLAVVHSIIRQHRGQIDIESRLGVGSTFRFLLPVSLGLPSPLLDRSAPVGTEDRRRVLVVDDDANVRAVTVRMLLRLGCDAQGVQRSSDAIAAVRAAMDRGEPFDLVVSDLTMPADVNGVELLTALRAIDPTLLGILSTGYCDRSLVDERRLGEIAGILYKPFRLDELAAVMGRCRRPPKAS